MNFTKGSDPICSPTTPLPAPLHEITEFGLKITFSQNKIGIFVDGIKRQWLFVILQTNQNQPKTPKQNNQSPPMSECEDIGFDDFETVAPTNDPRRFLPADLREQAAHLPDGEAYSVLQLAQPGQGHNASLLRVASICYKMGVSYEDTLAHLESQYDPARMDAHTAPRRAVARVWEHDGELSAIVDNHDPDLPQRQEELLLRFRRMSVGEVLERSPHKDPKGVPTPHVVKSLFAPGEIVNVQRSAVEAGSLSTVADFPEFLRHTRTRTDDWKFLNPAHFKKVEGVPNPTPDNPDKVSTRCNNNVKARPWIVLEMDDPDQKKVERFTGFAMQMAKFAPLHMVVDTGGKSLHFWFDGREADKATTKEFFKLACLHGGDPRLAVKSQIARMPNVSPEKDGRRRQDLIYFDPDGKAKPPKWDLPKWEEFLNLNRQIEFYYHGQNKNFYTKATDDHWIALDKPSVRSHLAEMGFRTEKMEGERVAPSDSVINSLQTDKAVDAALSGLCGRRAGYYEENGQQYIVRRSPQVVKPVRGQWPTIQKLLDGQFGHKNPQLDVLLGWLSSGVRDFVNDGRRAARFTQAQFLHIAGEPNAGKTLILENILPFCFGSRSANCEDLFHPKQSEFNAHLFNAELLFLDDTKILKTDYHSRQQFGEQIKSLTVGAGGGNTGFRSMQQDKVTVRPWWRFVRMMNTEPMTLATLPPMEPGVEDKIILLKANPMEYGPLGPIMQTGSGWFRRIQKMIEAEIPHFVHYLLKEHQTPPYALDPTNRYPVLSYKNEDLLVDFEQAEPHSQLLHKLDTEATSRIFSLDTFTGDDTAPPSPWMGSANDLYDILMVSGTRPSQDRFRKLCPSTQILVSQLRRLETDHPDRVNYSRRQERFPQKRRGQEYWILYPHNWIQRREAEELNLW